MLILPMKRLGQEKWHHLCEAQEVESPISKTQVAPSPWGPYFFCGGMVFTNGIPNPSTRMFCVITEKCVVCGEIFKRYK